MQIHGEGNKEYSVSFARRFWKWTGFNKKKLWDWLQFATSIAVPITIGWFTLQQDQIAERAKIDEKRNTEDNQRHEIMSDYLDQMTGLLLGADLSKDTPNTETILSEKAQSIARARTLSTLRQLDGERKGQLLKFLYEAGLIGGQCQFNSKTLETIDCQDSILDLGGARLEKITFERPVPLPGIDLTDASLPRAILRKIDLSNAEMRGANLKKADLSDALLIKSQMTKVILERASLVDATLREANLEFATLKHADLRGANLEQAILTGAELHEADLSNTNLQGADLRGTDLTGTVLQRSDLRGALYDNTTIFPKEFDPEGQGMTSCTTPIDQECKSLK